MRIASAQTLSQGSLLETAPCTGGRTPLQLDHHMARDTGTDTHLATSWVSRVADYYSYKVFQCSLGSRLSRTWG